MLTKEQILRKIEENREEIKKYSVIKLGLFGSYIRKEQREKSDIDILVEFEKGGKTFDNYMDLKFFLEELFGHGVDLVISDTIKPRLKPYIMTEVEYAEGL